MKKLFANLTFWLCLIALHDTHQVTALKGKSSSSASNSSDVAASDYDDEAADVEKFWHRFLSQEAGASVPRSDGVIVSSSDFFFDFLVVVNTPPTPEQVQGFYTFTNGYLTKYFQTTISQYQVEFFSSSLSGFSSYPASVDPPTRYDPAEIRVTFDSAFVKISSTSPTIPTMEQLDRDVAKAFEFGPNLIRFLVSLLTAFEGTPFGLVFAALYDELVIG
jgi:hypothetical protein